MSYKPSGCLQRTSHQLFTVHNLPNSHHKADEIFSGPADPDYFLSEFLWLTWDLRIYSSCWSFNLHFRM